MVPAALHWATSIKTRIDWSVVCHWSWMSATAMRLAVLYERMKRLERARAAVWMTGMTARGAASGGVERRRAGKGTAWAGSADTAAEHESAAGSPGWCG